MDSGRDIDVNRNEARVGTTLSLITTTYQSYAVLCYFVNPSTIHAGVENHTMAKHIMVPLKGMEIQPEMIIVSQWHSFPFVHCSPYELSRHRSDVNGDSEVNDYC